MPGPSVLVDTNILAELSRTAPNQGVEEWARSATFVSVSVITVEEVQFGISRKFNARVRVWLDRFFDQHCEILDVTRPIAVLAGTLRGQHGAAGQVRSQADMLIAATAAHHGLTLVTRNIRDFQGCGVALLDPFR